MSERVPKTVEDIPDEEFFAILFPESTVIPRGPRYPEHTGYHWRMEVYPNQKDWEAEIVRLESLMRQTYKGYHETTFKAIRAIPAKIRTTIQVQVD